MNKEKEVTVKQTIIDRLLAKCGYQKLKTYRSYLWN